MLCYCVVVYCITLWVGVCSVWVVVHCCPNGDHRTWIVHPTHAVAVSYIDVLLSCVVCVVVVHVCVRLCSVCLCV